MSVRGIDIKENSLRRTGVLLDLLLYDQTTNENIIWATDSYGDLGDEFTAPRQMKPGLVTGKHYLLIQPRAAKALAEQRRRTKDKAEVFTPLKIVKRMNEAVDGARVLNENNWREYVRELRLEITCGEAPFIAGRYDPTAHTGRCVTLDKRVGFLDKKLRLVSLYCHTRKEWLFWAREAFMASYGYEWQGDNVLLARENLLYTLIDFYKGKFLRLPELSVKEDFAKIISWNIFQMDGLRCVVPMSCRHEFRRVPGEVTLFERKRDTFEESECLGCRLNRPDQHNGKYVQVMDWVKGKPVRFVDLSLR